MCFAVSIDDAGVNRRTSCSTAFQFSAQWLGVQKGGGGKTTKQFDLLELNGIEYSLAYLSQIASIKRNAPLDGASKTMF
jgi:hypothetical protein